MSCSPVSSVTVMWQHRAVLVRQLVSAIHGGLAESAEKSPVHTKSSFELR